MSPQLDQARCPDEPDESQPDGAHPSGINVEAIRVQRRVTASLIQVGVEPERKWCIGDGVDEAVRWFPLDDLFMPAAIRNDPEQVPIRILGPARTELVSRIRPVVGDGEPWFEKMHHKIEVRRDAPDVLDGGWKQRRELEALDGLVARQIGHWRAAIVSVTEPLSNGSFTADRRGWRRAPVVVGRAGSPRSGR